LNQLRDRELKCIFFDLDHTLWDFDKNAEETLKHLYEHFALESVHSGSAHDFVSAYNVINNRLWQEYEAGVITKDFLRTERFKLAFEQIGIHKEKVPDNIWEMYLEMCPKKTNLMSGAMEVCEYLVNKYHLALITNGFEVTQQRKLKYSGLGEYFDHLVTSERVGHPKPNSEIYHVAMAEANVKPENCIMIGDNLKNDVVGALDVGIQAIWFNPGKLSNEGNLESIVELRQLTQLL
jgi:putative hydrolase of the HAD superfamily